MTIIHSSPSAAAALEQFDIKNSTAIQVGDLYFFSGMTAIDLSTFEVSQADVATQARITLENFGAMLGWSPVLSPIWRAQRREDFGFA